MNKWGQIVEAIITDENDKSYFAQVQGETFAVDKKHLDGETYQLGETIEGLIYEDMNRHKVLQSQLPDIRPGYFGWGTVTQVRKDLGVFVDVGLMEKDVVVSLDDLPENKDIWPRKGDRLYLTWEVDAKNRLWGKLATDEQLATLYKAAKPNTKNQTIDATILRVKMEGSTGISIEGYRVFIHQNEQVEPLRMGQVVRGRVIDVHHEGSMNLSLKPRAHEMIDDDAQMLLVLLKRQPNHFLPYHDRSDSTVIQSKLGISKSQFKRAVGQLMKKGLIKHEKGEGIWLLSEGDKGGNK
ncbi:S1-like domain-containing RNA-binding protein [Fundicoccus culcitae]|uniref:S1-like domain-containing RNA-binding protein n=1 Tax=Fundicoccus culcitae TaxID=2969821 RepID=A0ABY5P731_9LACT|nr:S1-like domain-containing RNA-binding protein [Fundicoccus culcitae]UUX34552.1 S1-like domain-containing RNA-binding protein [Fundicoccus culcitae]